MNTLHIKKGDNVRVLSGNEKGKTGKVVGVFPKTNLVLVEGVGMRKKHQKARREGQKGQIIDKHHPIHASKVVNTAAPKKTATKEKAAPVKKTRAAKK
ncbi:MAG: 50S ribosomal protein L24 [Candidatus Adlerbacteria bacterium]|nr:50S ribosomal protein L24 [Candidatus Adlerbacteria bacterium]